MKIGFIGLGIMGKPMALNLLKAGYEVTVSNRSRQKCAPLVAAGAKSGSYSEAAESCEVLITMLPNGPQVREVMLGENGVAARMKPGSTFIDMSSINPVDSRAIGAALADYGVEMLDAPVSGGEPKAIDGTLSIMVGGKQEIFDRYKDMLGAMGSSVVRCGELGAGNTTKLANQIIVACNIQALAEALTLAQKADRGQRQARLQDRPAHQGSEQRPGLRPRRRRAGAHDGLSAGDPPVAAQPRGRAEGSQRHRPVLRISERYPDRSIKRRHAMKETLRRDAERAARAAIRAVLPEDAVRRALAGMAFPGRVYLIAAGKAAPVRSHRAGDGGPGHQQIRPF